MAGVNSNDEIDASASGSSPLSSSPGRHRRSSGASDVADSMCNNHPRGIDSGFVCRPPSSRRKFRTLTFGRHYKTNFPAGQGSSLNPGPAGSSVGARECGSHISGGGGGGGCGGASAKKKRKNPWTFRFNYRLRRDTTTTDIADPTDSASVSCVCTGYRRTEEHHLGAGQVFKADEDSLSPLDVVALSDVNQTDDHQRSIISSTTVVAATMTTTLNAQSPLVSSDVLRWYDQYPIEDCDERARAERARELEEGVDPPPGFRPSPLSPLLSARRPQQQQQEPLLGPLGPHNQRSGTFELRLSDLAVALQSRLTLQRRNVISGSSTSTMTMRSLASSPTRLEPTFDDACGTTYCRTNIHTQVDYIHCLVPDLLEITRCAFYWGKMDRYEAESLLDRRPEGTFLLRDSAQDEYLFSVSFRRYGRSLHARVEQWNHRFSFDSHDPGVYSSTTVCGLVEHYKDPTCCMFFEPMLTLPLHRTFPFPLQHLCRAAIVGSSVTYDGINELRLPKPLKSYLKEYHYKQRVRVRLLEQQ